MAVICLPVFNPPKSQMAWLKGKMGRLDSIRSNRSISSSSTYIYGVGGRKQFHKSQLSLYDKISRKISLGRPASRKSSYGHSQVHIEKRDKSSTISNSQKFNSKVPILRPTVTVANGPSLRQASQSWRSLLVVSRTGALRRRRSTGSRQSRVTRTCGQTSRTST